MGLEVNKIIFSFG